MSKVFFFEKKKQKTFMSLDGCWRNVRDSAQKFFASFFQKRRPCLMHNCREIFFAMMKLLTFLMQTGGHIAGWRHGRAADRALCDVDFFKSLALTAERGLFDGVFLADYVGYHPVRGPDLFACLETPKLDPLLILATMAAHTKHVGLIATASTTYNEPYDIARRFSSLDHAMRKRIAPRAIG